MTETTDEPTTPPGRWATLRIALAGSLLLWLAQPPTSWSLLAWVAPLPWLYLGTTRKLAGRRPYVQIWLAGFAYWLLAIHWIRLAHPATFFGLLLLAGYLGVYLPLFVLVVRRGVLQLKLPLLLVAPVAWVAIEWLEAHLLGGFLMGALGHTQVENSRLIQIADLSGGYLVSALVMLVASCVWQIVDAVKHATTADELRLVRPTRRSMSSSIALALIVAVSALAAAWWYGNHRLAELTSTTDAPRKRLAIIQGNERAVWKADPDREQRVMDTYLRLSREAKQTADQDGELLDLMVWPEGAFRTLLYTYDEDRATTATTDVEEMASYARKDLRHTTEMFSVPLLVGIDRYHDYLRGEEQPGQLFNSAVAVGRDGNIIGTYDKTHLVMFGEYVPGGTLWPGIYGWFPIGGVTPGVEPKSFDIEGARYMPTICYETVIPHVIRRQVVSLADEGERPDVLVNVTNDSWFYDSSELEMHLTCTRFRAIECRTPVVVAANGGLSANVDLTGRVLDVSEPMTEEVLLVDVVPGGQSSLYLRHGDTFAILCLVGTVVVLVVGFVRPVRPAG